AAKPTGLSNDRPNTSLFSLGCLNWYNALSSTGTPGILKRILTRRKVKLWAFSASKENNKGLTSHLYTAQVFKLTYKYGCFSAKKVILAKRN
ncbi:MAG: hypothetical protein AAF734_09275, partial [Bacteroidota bacterium]